MCVCAVERDLKNLFNEKWEAMSGNVGFNYVAADRVSKVYAMLIYRTIIMLWNFLLVYYICDFDVSVTVDKIQFIIV